MRHIRFLNKGGHFTIFPLDSVQAVDDTIVWHHDAKVRHGMYMILKTFLAPINPGQQFPHASNTCILKNKNGNLQMLTREIISYTDGIRSSSFVCQTLNVSDNYPDDWILQLKS